VGCSDGDDDDAFYSEWGWSKAPYDCKKRLPSSELKALYSVDGECGATRFCLRTPLPPDAHGATQHTTFNVNAD
jgi:hypothetical protein